MCGGFPDRAAIHISTEVRGESLPAEGIQYVHMAELGGRRAARPDLHNTAWRNELFRGYADHMETGEFQQAIERLLDYADSDIPRSCARRRCGGAAIAV